jgi:hypothetical protein
VQRGHLPHEKHERWKHQLLRYIIENALLGLGLSPELALKVFEFDAKTLRKLAVRQRTGTQNIAENIWIVGHESSFGSGRLSMKYGDFSSLVQLGVGLHVGTALLQLYGELGVQPLVRTIARIRSLFGEEKERPPKEVEDELNKLESDFEIFKIQLFNEYKKYVKINSAVAVILVIVLTVLAYKAEDMIAAEVTIFIVAFSVLPAPVTLGALWLDAARAIRPIEAQADDLERRALRTRRKSEGETAGVANP